ncbi:MAG: hypothetical protein J2P18_09250 [Nocardia sp.]|nr:hypothetical protein [Nocardia sp.]
MAALLAVLGAAAPAAAAPASTTGAGQPDPGSGVLVDHLRKDSGGSFETNGQGAYLVTTAERWLSQQ